jgi:hypothetical protein
MENLPKKENMSLDKFRSEVQSLKEKEQNKTEEKTGHFVGCNPDELGEGEREIYEKYVKDILTLEELIEYRKKIIKQGNKSQGIFVGYIANMLMIRGIRNIGKRS